MDKAVASGAKDWRFDSSWAHKMPIFKREFSAGGIVFKKVDGKILWLIVQPEGGGHWSKDRFQFPKGLIEEGEKASQTAKREVAEETGVRAEIVQKADDLRIFFFDEEKNRVQKTISLFLMEFRKEGERQEDEEKIKEIFWLPFEKALEKLTFDTEKKALKKAKEILKEREKQQKLF